MAPPQLLLLSLAWKPAWVLPLTSLNSIPELHGPEYGENERDQSTSGGSEASYGLAFKGMMPVAENVKLGLRATLDNGYDYRMGKFEDNYPETPSKIPKI